MKQKICWIPKKTTPWGISEISNKLWKISRPPEGILQNSPGAIPEIFSRGPSGGSPELMTVKICRRISLRNLEESLFIKK